MLGLPKSYLRRIPWPTPSAALILELSDGFCARRGLASTRRVLRGIYASVLGRAPFTGIEKALGPGPNGNLEPPIFLLGHWRSGTTHLYNTMSLGDFGYVPPTVVGMPWEMLYLGRAIQPLLNKALPDSRYIDNIPVTPTSPQEDEIAIANMSDMSFYHAIYFPAQFEHFLNRGLFFDGASEAQIDAWKQAFLRFLRKLERPPGQTPLDQKPRLHGAAGASARHVSRCEIRSHPPRSFRCVFVDAEFLDPAVEG